MRVKDKIIDYMKKNNGTTTSRELDELGFHRQYLRELEQDARIERVERGVYVLAESFADDLYALQQRYQKGVFSHGTALFLHDMSDRTPLQYTMTFPHNYNASTLQERNVKVHRAKEELHQSNVSLVYTSTGHSVRAYDRERTLCDIVRQSGKLPRGEVIFAYRRYMAQPQKDIPKLLRLADELHVSQPVRQLLEVLL